MRAIITRPNNDGTYDEVGMNNRTITKNYKSKQSLKRYAIPDHFKNKGKLRIEYFINIYNEPFDIEYI